MISPSTAGRFRSSPTGALLAVAVLLVTSSCNDSPTDDGPVSSSVASVSLDPGHATLVAGETRQLSAVLRNARGDPLDGLTVSWVSHDHAVATVTATGLVTGVGPGETEMR